MHHIVHYMVHCIVHYIVSAFFCGFCEAVPLDNALHSALHTLVHYTASAFFCSFCEAVPLSFSSCWSSLLESVSRVMCRSRNTCIVVE